MHISIDGATWLFDARPLHPDSPAEGLLINVRMVNSVFEDDRPDLPQVLAGFQADANTDQFIARMPDYVAHGVDAFTISLQGGTPGYEGAVNSAFNANGTLRDAYLKRVSRVIHAADANGCAIILSCLYQRQHSHMRALSDKISIHAAITNTARWVASQGFTQVVLEISNEDDKVGPVGAEAARLSIISGAGWGFMHSAQNQSAPFQFAGRDDDPHVYDALARLTSPGYNPGDPTISPAFVLITDPKDGDTFSPNNPVTVRATLSGCRSIQGTRVQFFADDLLLGEVDSAPWHVRWQPAIPGRDLGC